MSVPLYFRLAAGLPRTDGGRRSTASSSTTAAAAVSRLVNGARLSSTTPSRSHQQASKRLLSPSSASSYSSSLSSSFLPPSRRASTKSRSGSNKGSKTAPSSSPGTLEQPDKFRPPSHPARLQRSSRTGAGAPYQPRQYGPETTAAERAAMGSKKYPNMMPPEGSWMHWLLTNRAIHVWFTTVVLLSLAGTMLVLDVKQKSPFADMLPSAGEAARNPFAAARQALQVMRLSAENTSRITAERRARELEEVRKRKAYRLAHGLEGLEGVDEADPILAAALASRLERDAAEHQREDVQRRLSTADGGYHSDDGASSDLTREGKHDSGQIGRHDDQDSGAGRSQKQVKKWFGIW